MRVSHINLVARSTDRLADFYKRVFGCEDLVARWHMSGEKFSRGNGVPGTEIYAARLGLPGAENLFLEIFEYKQSQERELPVPNQPGYGHICFEVADIQSITDTVLRAGGSTLGEVTDLGTPASPCLCVYLRDPEGNIIELEQN